MYSFYKHFDLVKVLCTAGDEDFKTAFEFFIANNLNQKLKWINNKTEFTPKGKYVLLCDLKNRLPGDIQRVLLELDITSKFAMRLSIRFRKAVTPLLVLKRAELKILKL